ncbi:MAG: sensor histidine kinase [Terriglobales bacterium]
MFPLARVPRFLTRLNAPPDAAERLRTERVLASARIFLASAGALAIYLDPTEPSRYATLAYLLLFGYLAYSLAVWMALDRLQKVSPSFLAVHAFDMIFPAVFTLFTAGPNSPFFLYFVFVLTAAAFRWGLWETAATSGFIASVILFEGALLRGATVPVFHMDRQLGSWGLGEYEINRFIIRLSYLVILGVLLGYLAEEEKQLRAENAVVRRITNLARVETGLRGTMQAILGELMRIFIAPRALAIMQQSSSGRIFLWQSDPTRGARISSREVPPEERSRHADPFPGLAFYTERRGSGWASWALEADGRRTRLDGFWSPEAVPQLGSARSLQSVGFNLGQEWTGRVLLFDARMGINKFGELRFVQKLLGQVGPAIYTIYLLRRLRSRAGAIERARVARELHDGAIQALIAVEMEVDVLRRQASRPAEAGMLAPQLQRIQEMLREQVLDLRTLMQQMRPVELSPGQLLDFLADTVERFRRDTGIKAEFVSGLEEVDLAPRVCRELVRIVQEALTNVRKHSGATRVLVRFGQHGGRWILGVEDDGRGFDFPGKKDLAELEACHKGPSILKERVRALDGELSIESLPGQGSKLEVALTQKGHAAYV